MCGKIKIKQGTKTIPVMVKDIIRFEGGKGNCCYIFLANGKSYKITGNIGEWMKDAEIIASGLFVLAHRSHLINYKQVDSYDRMQGATMLSNNNDNIPLTEKGFEELEKRIFSDEQNLEDNYPPIQHERKIIFQRREKDEDEISANDEEE